ncbi:MAG: hypothetical protein ACFB02_08275 [Mastigocoleus sp.]
MTEQQQITEERQNQYFALIDELLRCPNGQEPEVLKTHSQLLDADFIKIALRVATVFAHDGNQEGAEFLIHIARELSKELGLYPDIPEEQKK